MCYVPLLVGFATGFRRSELAALNRENIEFTEQGMVIHQRRSKTDQEGKGRRLDFWRGGALCPVRALEKWLKTANITSGAIFLRVHRSGAISGKAMSGESVAAVVQPEAGVAPGPDLSASILASLDGRLARMKWPKSIDFTEQLPRDPSGKLLKRRLRDPYWQDRDVAI